MPFTFWGPARSLWQPLRASILHVVKNVIGRYIDAQKYRDDDNVAPPSSPRFDCFSGVFSSLARRPDPVLRVKGGGLIRLAGVRGDP